MSGKPFGQIAYEAFYDATPGGRGLSWHDADRWRDFWEAAGQAVAAEAVKRAEEASDAVPRV